MFWDLTLQRKTFYGPKSRPQEFPSLYPWIAVAPFLLSAKNTSKKVAKSRPEFAFTKLDRPLKVSVARPSISLHAVGQSEIRKCLER